MTEIEGAGLFYSMGISINYNKPSEGPFCPILFDGDDTGFYMLMDDYDRNKKMFGVRSASFRVLNFVVPANMQYLKKNKYGKGYSYISLQERRRFKFITDLSYSSNEIYLLKRLRKHACFLNNEPQNWGFEECARSIRILGPNGGKSNKLIVVKFSRKTTFSYTEKMKKDVSYAVENSKNRMASINVDNSFDNHLLIGVIGDDQRKDNDLIWCQDLVGNVNDLMNLPRWSVRNQGVGVDLTFNLGEENLRICLKGLHFPV